VKDGRKEGGKGGREKGRLVKEGRTEGRKVSEGRKED
jgi:hypothetical protein